MLDGWLQDLKILAISRTQIAEVPVPLGLWPLLTELSLSNCRIEELPTSLGACESLRLLDVHENRLESLPSSTRLLQSLQRLWISGNNLVVCMTPNALLRMLDRNGKNASSRHSMLCVLRSCLQRYLSWFRWKSLFSTTTRSLNCRLDLVP